MKILFVDQSDQPLPPPGDVIRADTYVSIPLAEELKRRGHDITFLCPAGSEVKTKKIFTSTGPLVSIIPLEEFNAIENADVRTELLWTFYVDLYFKLVETVKQEHFDLIHFHTNVPTMELVALSQVETPCLFTLHSVTRNPDQENKIIKTFNTRPNNYFSSISYAQEKTFPAIKFLQRVQHGVDTAKFSFSPEGGDQLLFVGRLKKKKGLDDALEVSLRLKRKIQITGAVSYTDQEFFRNEVMPVIESHPDLMTYSGVVDRAAIQEFYKNSKVTLVPVKWEEPFGLIMIESMACGTPVIAFARGSVPEIIKDGVTGFIVNSSEEDKRGDWIIKKSGIEGLQEAVGKIYAMSSNEYQEMRKACRRHVEENFTVEKMVNGYENVYKKVLEESKKS